MLVFTILGYFLQDKATCYKTRLLVKLLSETTLIGLSPYFAGLLTLKSKILQTDLCGYIYIRVNN